ncbi:MAG: VirB4 family type IV secretion/conjugal transfer ATPase [Steroidobacteraceae bacterium]|jgi:type IV secretion system protein VirB4
MRALNRSSALRREIMAAERVPYAAHVAPHVVRTTLGDYLQTFRLGGGFETNDDSELNNWHERLNVLWRNIAGPNVALWTHVVRRRAPVGSIGAASPAPRRGHYFADRLLVRYQQRIFGATLMQNEIYLSVLYRPAAGLATGLVSRVLARTERDGTQRELAEALDACEKLSQTLRASLQRYEPELLGCYEYSKAWYSSLLEYLGLLINGEWQRMPLRRAPLSQMLASTRLLFGSETIEYRSPTETRVGAMLGIKEYPTPTSVGMYDQLLSAPFSFVLTQSFAFLTKATSQALLQRQFNRMANAGDFAVSQAAELKDALDALTSNDFVMGDHHFALQVLADIGEGGDTTPASRLKVLNDGVALARSLLADTGMLVAREDLALEAAFWAQLPGNFPVRPRKSPITSRNLAAMAPFHNYPMGRAAGNHWGDALTVLITSARSPYYFSLHASDPGDPDGGSRKDTGHTLICGPTGSGKTVLIGFLISMLARQDVTQIVFDKDRGLEILVRALGGEYLPLRNGTPTGFNPLQLPVTPANVEFLKTWLHELCAMQGGNAMTAGSVRDLSDLDQALRGTLALDASARRLSRLVEFLDPTDPEGLHARLSRWCESGRGEYAWVFDNPVDTLASRLPDRSVIGFDVTEFLDHALTRAPITLYLFHLVRQLLDGRKLVCWMDEFWRLLADPAFEAFAKDGPKTWRKLNGVMCLATQSASDVLQSPISRTLVEQTPTKIFFPNADASFQEYTEGFGLTSQEFRLLKEQLEPGSRMFLVKQAHHSVVCQLDLKDFDGELKVISGRVAEVTRMSELIRARGADPAAWLPIFMSPQ